MSIKGRSLLFERTTKRPVGYDNFVAHVKATNAPGVVMVDLDLIRELVKYVEQLETEAQGNFF